MEEFLNTTGNFFFPICLSIFLIIRIDKFLTIITNEMTKIKETQTKILLVLESRSDPR